MLVHGGKNVWSSGCYLTRREVRICPPAFREFRNSETCAPTLSVTSLLTQSEEPVYGHTASPLPHNSWCLVPFVFSDSVSERRGIPVSLVVPSSQSSGLALPCSVRMHILPGSNAPAALLLRGGESESCFVTSSACHRVVY